VAESRSVDGGGAIPVDLDAVARWMDDQGLGSGPITAAAPLAGGTQNVLVRFSRDGVEYVLRRGPLHLRPKSNDAITREMAILDALKRTDVPHPAFVAGCRDTTVLGGAVFYLMEPVDGINPTTVEPLPEHRERMGFSAVEAVSALGSVDHLAVGLGSLGHSEGFLERQVPQWLRALASYQQYEGYVGPQVPHVDEVARWLESHVPQRFSPGLMHGDYHLANLLYDGPEVAAIVDWEMCTVGDPLLDLGWFCVTLPAPGSPPVVGEITGLPAVEDLVAAYTARPVDDIAWYVALAGFKLGLVLEGTHARACAGLAPREIGDRLHAMAVELLRRAAVAAGV